MGLNKNPILVKGVSVFFGLFMHAIYIIYNAYNYF